MIGREADYPWSRKGWKVKEVESECKLHFLKNMAVKKRIIKHQNVCVYVCACVCVCLIFFF